MDFYQFVKLAAVLLTGLVAGLFYGYACSVTGGLEKLSNSAYLSAFQSINRVIQNIWFFTIFIGSLIALPLAAWLSYRAGVRFSFWLLLAATAMYVVGVFVVTIRANVPLNSLLKHLDLNTATPQELSLLREQFEAPWNKWNLIRTVAAVLSFLLAVLSLIR